MTIIRPDWDDFYLGIAKAASARGDCTRSQVGAVIVLRTSRGHLTSIGYNGVSSGEPGCLSGACPRGRMSYEEFPSDLSSYGNCISTHAEINAFYNAQFDIQDSDVYVTRAPCDSCKIVLFRQEMVSRIVWPEGQIPREEYLEGVNAQSTEDLF